MFAPCFLGSGAGSGGVERCGEGVGVLLRHCEQLPDINLYTKKKVDVGRI